MNSYTNGFRLKKKKTFDSDYPSKHPVKNSTCDNCKKQVSEQWLYLNSKILYCHFTAQFLLVAK